MVLSQSATALARLGSSGECLLKGLVTGTLESGLALGNCGRGPELAAYMAAMDKLRRLGETSGKFLRRELSNI